jgi:hypothetical protein
MLEVSLWTGPASDEYLVKVSRSLLAVPEQVLNRYGYQ